MRKIAQFLLSLGLALSSFFAFAGGSNPGLYYGQIPTAAQWNSYFAAKLDYTPGAVNAIPYWDGSGNLLNSLITGDCTSAANVFTCTHASNITGGTQWGVLYQSAVGTTASTAAGTAGFVLTSNATSAPTFQNILGVTAGKAVQVDQAVTAWTRAATTTLGTSLNGTLSDTSTTITAFNGVAGVTYHVRALGAGIITYHATNLIITQGLADITTAAGDTFDVEMLTATTSRIKNYVAAVKLGEIISSEIPSGSAISLTSGVGANITSITITPGRWKITAEASFIGDGTTSVAQYQAGINTTSATYPAKARFRVISSTFVPAAGVGIGGPTGDLYIEVSANTPIYLVAGSTFTIGTFVAFGNIYATRY